MHSEIADAFARAYGFGRWSFANEFEFKHEVFHQLALKTVNGVGLSKLVPGSPTCRLHAEAKVKNGNARKADLLICNPLERQRFNYAVDYIIELKARFNSRIVSNEVAKLCSYGRPFKGLYLAAPIPGGSWPSDLSVGGQEVHIFDPASLTPIKVDEEPKWESGRMDLSRQVVLDCIDQTLLDYGRGRQQYHGFFWCNYEHEEGRRHSFPSEGDFNAHLYHRLRMHLPPGVEIRSEVHPSGEPQRRVDFVVRGSTNEWAIPIEVKMNWDQFKPKFKNGVELPPESTIILDRLSKICASYRECFPVIVVIQGAWQSGRDFRGATLDSLADSPLCIELALFNEDRDQIDRKSIGGK